MKQDTPQASGDPLLIDRIARGDRLAMQVLFSRHRVRVFRFLLRYICDEASAEDVLADVFIDVWRQAGRLEGRSNVSTWMLSMARFKALSRVRQRSDAPLDEEHAAGIADEADDPEIDLAKRDKGAALRNCLAKLSVDHREMSTLSITTRNRSRTSRKSSASPPPRSRPAFSMRGGNCRKFSKQRVSIEAGHDHEFPK